MGFNTTDINNINLNNYNFDEDDPKTFNQVKFMTWHNRFTQRKAYKNKISKELMPVTWRSKSEIGAYQKFKSRTIFD